MRDGQSTRQGGFMLILLLPLLLVAPMGGEGISRLLGEPLEEIYEHAAFVLFSVAAVGVLLLPLRQTGLHRLAGMALIAAPIFVAQEPLLILIWVYMMSVMGGAQREAFAPRGALPLALRLSMIWLSLGAIIAIEWMQHRVSAEPLDLPLGSVALFVALGLALPFAWHQRNIRRHFWADFGAGMSRLRFGWHMAPLLGLVMAYVVFHLFPQVDLFVSWLYLSQEQLFWAERMPVLQLIRHGIAALTVLLALVALALWGWFGLRRRASSAALAVWRHVSVLYLLGPGLLVNELLKSYWGRARPIHVFEQGLSFSPAFEVAGQCTRNCSFVSGEAAGSMAFFLAVIALVEVFELRFGWPVWARWGVIGIAAVLTLAGIWLRVMMGGHFLSDVVFGALFVVIIDHLLRGYWPLYPLHPAER